MGTKKISALPSAATLDGTEQLELVQSSTSKNVTTADLATDLLALAEAEAVLDLYVLKTDLAAVTPGEGAGMVGIEDAGAYYTGVTVEAAMAEVGASIASIEDSLAEIGININVTINAQVGTSYTVTADDRVITMDNASANYVLINDGVFSAGDVVEIWQLGAGQTEIRADTGMTINIGASQTLYLKEQYSGCSLRFLSGSVALIIGDTEAA